ncbi:MAG: radical SAM protein [Myxococcota bacterium]
MENAGTLRVHEIYESIQGESSFAGLPCAFVRLSRCNLRCRWCDTPQAFVGGVEMHRAEVLDKALAFGTPLVEVTGGEPLLQQGAIPLLAELCDAGRTVLLETSGERDISQVDPRVHRIVDFKAPGSGESARNRWANVDQLTRRDEVKLVLADRADYDWAKVTIDEYDLTSRVHTVLLSGVWGELDPKSLVEWVLADRLAVRVQLQTHKYIWGGDAEGV